MVRHVHRVAPLDIFPRVHDYFLENYDWSPGEGRGGFSPTETKNFSLSLYILSRDVNEETVHGYRSSIVRRIPLEDAWTGNRRRRKKKKRRRLNCQVTGRYAHLRDEKR